MSFLTGSKKSSQSSRSELPDWMVGPAKEMLQRSLDTAEVGYMPYAGPEVAALDPMQIASMQGAAGAADAFGLPSAMPNIPQATDFGGGMHGYSSMPLYDQQMAWLEQNRPGQKSFYDSLFVDPSGAPAEEVQPAPQQPAQPQMTRDEMLDFLYPDRHRSRK